MDLSTFEHLLAPEGQALLREVEQSREPELALGTRLRKQHSADLVAAAITQHELRIKAAGKYGTTLPFYISPLTR